MKRTRFTRVLKVEPLRLAVAIGVVLWAWGVPILAAQEAAGKPSEVQNEAGEAAASADA